jgi:hypothetical protein
VLVISTRDWWHSTRLPAAATTSGIGDSGPSHTAVRGDGVSVSVAREFNLTASSRQPGRSRHPAPALRTGTRDEDDEAATFINVDGLFATRAIAAGTVILTEEEAADVELPVSSDDPNCEVVELDDLESGGLALVARRDVRSGEFLCVAAD